MSCVKGLRCPTVFLPAKMELSVVVAMKLGVFANPTMKGVAGKSGDRKDPGHVLNAFDDLVFPEGDTLDLLEVGKVLGDEDAGRGLVLVSSFWFRHCFLRPVFHGVGLNALFLLV